MNIDQIKEAYKNDLLWALKQYSFRDAVYLILAMDNGKVFLVRECYYAGTTFHTAKIKHDYVLRKPYVEVEGTWMYVEDFRKVTYIELKRIANCG